ncbi:MAG: hypothetical protein HY918_01135 [Candidatus Doudnabacteria bacterium]|nr:hypothetical protein [Candidatus Doudnabacteria bacterium]
MTKIQKIWLWILVATFAVPELLWSVTLKSRIALTGPMVNGHYKVFRKNFLDDYGNSNLWNNLMLLQLIGIVCLFIYLIFLRKTFKSKIIFWFSEIILFLLGLFVFMYYSLATVKITF